MPIHEKYYPPNQEPPKESIIERYTPEPEPYPQEPEIEYETIETCSSPIEPEQTNIFHEKIAGDYIGEVVNRTIIGNSISAQPKPKTITPIHERILPYVVMDGGYTLDITPAEYQDVTNGLVGWWKLEGDGTDSYDGLPATVIGAIPTTDRFDRENSALYFDGINDVADIGTSTDLRINAVTVCGWFKTNSNTAGWLFVKKARSYGGWVGYGVNLGLYETGKIAVRIQQSASPSFIDKRITKSFNDNKWHHVAFTYTGSIFRLYYDGVREPTMDGTGGAIYYYKNHNASIGAERSISVWENFFVGSISDVRVYNRALSESEISVVYNRVLNVTTTSIVSDPIGSPPEYQQQKHQIKATYEPIIEDVQIKPQISATHEPLEYLYESSYPNTGSPPEWIIPPPDFDIIAGSGISFTILASAATEYTVTGLPVGAILDPVTGSFSWIPTSGDVLGAPYVADFRAINDIGYAQAECDVTGILWPTWTVPPSDFTILETYNTSFTLEATGTGPITYSVTGLPSGATIDANTGYFSWTPTSGDMLAMPYTGVFAATNEAGYVESSIIPVEYNITSGLVGWWKLDGTTIDYTYRGHDGIPYNISYTTDRFGLLTHAAALNGSDSYITVPTHIDFTLVSGYTISSWVNIKNTYYGSNVIVVGQWGAAGAGNASFFTGVGSYNKTKMGNYNPVNGTKALTNPYDAPHSTWAHICYVYTGGISGINGKMYINGEISHSGTIASYPQYSTNYWVGFGRGQVMGTNAYYSGDLSQIRIYNRALSSGEINQLYHYIGS